jgi:molybdopterin-guanine dinucleotide biosynthesis protein A
MNGTQLTGLVLAGGRGLRMGGADKGLVLLSGRPLVQHVLERLRPQVGEILISANRGRDAYARFGHRVLPDVLAGQLGPLAGLHAGLTAARTPLLLSVPCDCPFLPADLAPRMQAGLERQAAQIAVATTDRRAHPVFLLCRREVLADLAAYLADGGRKVDAWYARLPAVLVPFDDQPDAFLNVNTLDDLRALEGADPPP